MASLILFRHAKSTWDDPRLADRDRPLAPRGERAALVMGEFLRQQGLAPDLALCSNARRARDTLTLAVSRLPRPPEAAIEAGLYLCGWPALLARLGQVDPAVGSVLLVGHNPDLHELATTLAGDGPAEALRRLRRKLPSGGLAVLDVADGAWPALARGSGKLRLFETPKRLA